MKARITLAKSFCFSKLCFAAMGAIFLIGIALPARADNLDPFQMDTGNWMSFQRYKDNVKRGLIIPQEKAANNSQDAASPADQITSSVAPATAVDSAQPKTAIAAPTRPLALPVMPGVNKGYDVRIDTTDDDKRDVTAPVLTTDGATDMHLQTQNWVTAAEAARDAARARTGQTPIDNRAPLDVRMSYLPDPKITPIPDPEHKSAHGRPPPVAPAIHAADELKALPADLAACVAVVDAYKKKQLEALQSDRQTLTALQEAIAQLGLQKQLGFLADTKSNLNATAQNVPASADMPAPKESRP
jgi:hypothetical protein